ncbi:MAG: sensory protein [Bdellovibrionaceae bacterium]|nr:sensory protein [Pseudobdellovibrionaceae bacterium]
MERPVPTGKEKFFRFEELFFSTTDSQGVIRFGNDIFVQISAYPRETMIGAPHSLIRHPGVPRSVFKVFWSFLKSNRAVGAYVCNMAADGAHYWVFAVAFPIQDGYLSIRLRPSSPLLAKVKDIYAEVLKKEAQAGMEGGESLLSEILVQNGFADYEALMTEALRLELQARDEQLMKSRKEASQDEMSSDDRVGRIRSLTQQGSDIFQGIFQMVRDFQESKDVFSQKTADMIRRFQGIRFLSINMTASAEKLGSSATTLSVISGEFQRMSGEIEKQLRMFLEVTSEIALDMQKTSFTISSLKFQMDMVAFFVQESLEKIARQDQTTDAFHDMESNRLAFEELSEESIRDVLENLSRLRKKLGHFVQALGEIETFASGLEVVRQMGNIESARSQELQQAFENQISELKEFTGFLKDSSSQLRHSTQALNESAAQIEKTIPSGGTLLKQIFEQAMK